MRRDCSHQGEGSAASLSANRHPSPPPRDASTAVCARIRKYGEPTLKHVTAVPVQYASLAFVLSFVIVAVVVFTAHRLIGRAKNTHLVDIMRDDDWYPSLALFQFVMWTSSIGFLFLGVYLTRAFAGVIAFPPAIPTNLLVLMGISVAVPIVSGGISGIKYTTDTPKERPDKLKPFSSMLEENNKPTLARFQMFIWTWLGIIIYLALFIAMITQPGALENVENLSLPDIDPTLVALMGLSQAAYIGGKAVASQAVELTRIEPEQGKVGQSISLLGDGFGGVKPGEGAVWFDDVHVPSSGIDNWSSSRIDLKVPSGLAAGSCSVKVVVGSSISPPRPFQVTT